MATAKEQLAAILSAKGKSQYLNQAWQLISMAAGESRPEIVLASRFSPQGVAELLPIVAAYEKEIEAQYRLESEVQAQLHNHSAYMDDDALYEANAYAIVFSDRVEFVAHVPGYGDKLPRKGRKYIGDKGDIRWQFPVSSLDEIRRFADFVLNEDGSLSK